MFDDFRTGTPAVFRLSMEIFFGGWESWVCVMQEKGVKTARLLCSPRASETLPVPQERGNARSKRSTSTPAQSATTDGKQMRGMFCGVE